MRTRIRLLPLSSQTGGKAWEGRTLVFQIESMEWVEWWPSKNVYLKLQKVILLGMKGFADVIKLRILRWWSSWISMAREGEMDSEMQRGRPKIGTVCLPAKECPGMPAATKPLATRELGTSSPSAIPEGTNICPHLDFSCLAPQNCERINFSYFKPSLWHCVTTALGN